MSSKSKNEKKRQLLKTARLLVCYVCLQPGGTLEKDEVAGGYKHPKCRAMNTKLLEDKGIVLVKRNG